MKNILLKSLVLLFTGALVAGTFAADETGTVKNMLKHDFSKLGKDGLPVGYKVTFDKASKGKATVIQEAGVNIVKLELPEQGKAFLDSTFLLGMKKNRRYLFTIQLKIDNQAYTGKGVHFFYACAYNTGNNKHIYNKVMQQGSTDGWITAVLPIDTAKRPLLVGAKLFLRSYYVSGTYWLKNPMLIELPKDVEIKAHYILANDETISGPLLRLKPLVK
ncbi:MAG: hypothetical protein L3J71_14475 [Victivallaceae bacterium]|nr:hypothetical protein [Victivallaceae bacterium]